MIFAIIWFSCALMSFWLWSWITYHDCSVMTKHDFITTLALCIIAAPVALVGCLISIVLEYLDAHGKDEVHFMDRFFKKGDKDD